MDGETGFLFVTTRKADADYTCAPAAGEGTLTDARA